MIASFLFNDSSFVYRIKKVVTVIVKGNNRLKDIHSMVIGRTGIVYQNTFQVEEDKNTFTFEIPISKSMAPSCHLIVFYVHRSGEIVFDRKQLKFNNPSNNLVDLLIEKFYRSFFLNFSSF